LSSFKHGGILIETRGGNSYFDVKRIKSKIDKYKINNNNTSTKHEFNVQYEGKLDKLIVYL
jgi:hypothetical protein